MYLVGEALVGDGAELAHIDLIIGDKEGPVGTAFANALSQLSAGHTPLLAVVRPNLLTKPATLVIPKVTIRKGAQVAEMFGPVQAAVAKAVADSVEEGIFTDRDPEALVILASVYLNPDAADYNRRDPAHQAVRAQYHLGDPETPAQCIHHRGYEDPRHREP
jgi:bifunctional enzyme Fae/Hps